MTATPRIVLASVSPHRSALLKRLGLPFATTASQVLETVLPGEPPEERARRLALAKARAVAEHHAGWIVIGSDQVASLPVPGGSRLLHKPGNRATCREQLSAMSGGLARFDTGVAVIRDGQELVHVDLTCVQVRRLGATEIERYMDREPAFDCAGGFKCEGLGVSLFESIETRDPTALVGLPLIWVCEALRQLGVSV
jgi:septum formation protein